MVRESISIYWSIIRPRKWLWVLAFGMHTLFYVGVNILQPLLISRFVNDLTHIGNFALEHFVGFVWIWVGLHLVQTVFGRIGIYAWFHVLAYSLRDIDLKSFQITLSQGSDFFANNFTGSLVTRFNRFTRSFEQISTSIMFDFNSLLVQIVVPFCILLFIAPLIGVIMTGWTIIFSSILIYLHRRKIIRSRLVAKYDSDVTGAFADVVTNALPVKMFSSLPDELSAFLALSNKRVKARMSNAIFGDFIRLYKVCFIIILEVPVFLLSAKFAIEGKMNVGQIILIQLYIQQLLKSLWDFGKVVEKLEEALADSTEMVDTYNQLISVRDPDKPQKFRHTQGAIEFRNVNFSYDGDNFKPVFQHLNLSIPVGQKVGLVGPSGGGKTTLTKLLLRFMDVSSGEITIDGLDISTVTQNNLRDQIAYVPQEPLLFHRTIYENIAYGDPSATRDEVLTVAKLAHADEFISKLAHGYDTFVGERGVKLSGGQKQRVTIARAMLKKSPILLLDEATSALDSKSEKLITAALDNLMKSRTTIVIAHRLSTIRKLDRILVLENGSIVEDGTHAELHKTAGIYSELWRHQHGDFLESENDFD